MGNRIALYFGSFNPIHNGHLSIANYVLDNNLCDELWFVVSPHNPLKEPEILCNEQERLEMARMAATEWNSAIKVTDIEFMMSKPSYTIRTIKKLMEQHPEKHFSLLMGEDNIIYFDRWRKWQEIIQLCDILIYPRGDFSHAMVSDKIRELILETGVKSEKFKYLSNAPRINISSTEIREKGNDIEGMTAPSVINYIKEKRLYDRK